ncbi:MAG: hypothetical protein ACKVU0_14650, partial [Saprospiraceae bacterium]
PPTEGVRTRFSRPHIQMKSDLPSPVFSGLWWGRKRLDFDCPKAAPGTLCFNHKLIAGSVAPWMFKQNQTEISGKSTKEYGRGRRKA